MNAVKNSSRSRSRNRMFRGGHNKSSGDDYFSNLANTSGPGFHSPPILEDDDELKDILADQPPLPSFGITSDLDAANDNYRRRAIEEEMENDVSGIFGENLRRGTEVEDMIQDTELASPKPQVPKVKFYNSSEDETTENDESDHENDVQKSNTRIAQNSDEGSSSGTIGKSNDEKNHEDKNKEESEEHKESFRDRFKRKMSVVFNEDDEVPVVPGDETIFSKILKLGDVGGLAPGASKAEPMKPLDEEEEIGFDDLNSIPLKLLNAEELNAEARDIIKSHDFYQNRNESGSTFNFYNPNPEYHLRDDLDDFDEPMLDGDGSVIKAPKKVQAGVLSSLLKMYLNPQLSLSSQTLIRSDDESMYSRVTSPFSGKSDLNPKELKSKLKKMGSHVGSHVRNASLSGFFNNLEEEASLSKAKLAKVKSATTLSDFMHAPGKQSKNSRKMLDEELKEMPSFQSTRPKVHRKKRLLKTKRDATKAKITVHIEDVLLRQRFILRMCKALMLYGAPTHRLEEYMMMTARVLEIDGQFVYFPGVMIVSFGDSSTRTSEVQVVRCNQGLDLSKLYDVHKVYKAVVHDLMGVDEASAKIDELLSRKPIYPPWLCVLFYGLGSAMVTSWGFRGGWRDIPISFGIGLCVGFLQFYVSPRSSLYSNVFEVTASIVVSFLGRALGSIHGGRIFCFGGIVQGSLALILPGYIILCGSLELQSRNLVAGSVRMFYAIIYSLFLGFGITLGAAIYGWIDGGATSDTTCPDSIQLSPYYRFLFVPGFSICLGLINQARISQLPAMIIIAGLGYVVTYFAGLHFSNNTEFTASMGAFVIGILGNLYSRLGRGMAVSAMLPAIFVQVPSGIASQSSLLSGVQSADSIVNNSTSEGLANGSSLTFGATMVEVAIGISVGLFAATIVVYPLGKKRTGLFTL